MSFRIRPIFVLFIIYCASAQANLCEDVFSRPVILKREIEVSGRPVAIEILRRTRPSPNHLTDPAHPQPPLVLLVGGLAWRQKNFRPLMKKLSALELDTASMSFSTQPDSFLKISEEDQSLLALGKLTSSDFAQEVISAAQALRKDNQDVILVTLSYSSSLVPNLSKISNDLFSKIILISPLVRAGEIYPKEAKLAQGYEGLLSLNPFFGRKLIDGFREKYTRNYAKSMVESFGDYYSPANVKASVVEDGLVSMIRATEEFDLEKELVLQGREIHFILGTDENPDRLANQVQSFSAMRAKRNDSTIAFIPGESHVTFAKRPETTALMIGLIASGKVPANKSVWGYIPEHEAFIPFDAGDNAAVADIAAQIKARYHQ